MKEQFTPGKKRFYAVYDNECGTYIETGYNYTDLTEIRNALIELESPQIEDESDFLLFSKMSLENMLSHLHYTLESDIHPWPDTVFP